jgi:menaquinone-dependent protoporphyrinogen oxidase
VTKEVTMRILVTYASKHGSTEEVAEVVAYRLREAGLSTHLVPAAEVEDLEGYDGVVIGTALYMGRVHHDARHLLKRFHRALASMPVAVYAMGPRTLEEREVAGSRKQLGWALSKVPDIEPVAVAIFGGVLHKADQPFPFNRMPETDARDWDAIREWAEEVASVLYERNPVSADSTRSGSVSRL